MMPTHGYDLNLGIDLAQRADKSRPVHEGHRQVGDDQPHLGLVLCVLGQPLCSIGSLNHLVAVPFQGLSGHPRMLSSSSTIKTSSPCPCQGIQFQFLLAVFGGVAGRQVNLELGALSQPV